MQLLSRWRWNWCPTNRDSKNSHVSFLTVLCLQDMFMFALDSAVSHSSHYPPAQSHDHKDGSLAVVIFDECFFAKTGRGAPLRPPLQVDHQTLHFPHQATDSILLSDVSLESFSDTLRLRYGCISFTWWDIPSIRNNCELIIFVTQPRSNFMVHQFSDLVKAILRIWRYRWRRQPLLPLIRICGSC